MIEAIIVVHFPLSKTTLVSWLTGRDFTLGKFNLQA